MEICSGEASPIEEHRNGMLFNRPSLAHSWLELATVSFSRLQLRLQSADCGDSS